LREFHTYWVHFVPESFFLHHLLGAVEEVRSWNVSAVAWMQPVFERLPELFEDAEGEHPRPRPNPPAPVACRVEAALMALVADLIESLPEGVGARPLLRLKPAIDFMDGAYLRHPSLAEVAASAHLAPNYFHRVFARQTGVTPFAYMERKRLDRARRLLSHPGLNIGEVAARCGYENAHYFSRAFRKRFGCPPSAVARSAAAQP
jgi:AraC-like DNA-binding protein